MKVTIKCDTGNLEEIKAMFAIKTGMYINNVDNMPEEEIISRLVKSVLSVYSIYPYKIKVKEGGAK